MMGVGPHDGQFLTLYGTYIAQGFGHVPYQVGSSLTQKRGWRDVDVRLILPDEEYVGYFGDFTTPAHGKQRLTSWEMAWTMFGRHLTRLPIDFQIQAQTVANEEHDGPRSALRFFPEDGTWDEIGRALRRA